MAPNPLQAIIKTPIRSTLCATILTGGLWYAYDHTSTTSLMTYNCQKAASYGDQKLRNPLAPVRHITVILNPAAGKRKSKALYSKWVEPLLHLAGIKVSLIETHSLRQVYDLMKVMSNCDGVAIVGGDDTVHEALNGLMHRQDNARAAQNFPIAIIPAGQHNSIARYIYQLTTSYRNRNEFAIQTTAQLVDSVTSKFDVLKITPLNRASEEGDHQPTYALRDLRYGLYQDDYLKLAGISIYQNYVKPIWMRMLRTFRRDKYTEPKIEEISYTEPCTGCSRCYARHQLVDNVSAEDPAQQLAKKRWWGSIVATKKPENPVDDPESKREREILAKHNPDCGKWIQWSPVEEVTDFRAAMIGDTTIRIGIGKSREKNPSEVFEVQDVKLRVSQEFDEQAASQLDNPIVETPKEGEEDANNKAKNEKGLLIDRKVSPIQSLEITTLRNAVTIFTGAPRMFVGDNPFAIGRK